MERRNKVPEESLRSINEIALGKCRIPADTALRLARCFGTMAKFWLGLQTDYDLDVAASNIFSRFVGEI